MNLTEKLAIPTGHQNSKSRAKTWRRAGKSQGNPGSKPPLARESAGFSGKNGSAIICLLLTAVTFAIYFPVVRYPFVNYDDDVYIINNSHVNTGLNWQNLRWACTSMTAGNWHPVTWISHDLDSMLFGLHAGGHHLTSVALHILNALLLFLLLQRATGERWRSAMVGALFALHPLNVESVAWAAERKNLLCTLFFLLTLAAYGWYARKPRLKPYLCVAGLFALALASKPMAVTLPFVLLLVDFWPLGRIESWSSTSPVFPVPERPFSRLVLEKLPLLCLSTASALVTIIAQKRADALASGVSWSAAWRIENAVHSYAVYLWKTFFPWRLAPFYPALLLHNWAVGLALISLLGIAWMVWTFRGRGPFLVTGFLLFLGMLVPVIGLVQVGGQSMADRYTYMPCVGIFIAAVWGIGEIAKSAQLHRRLLVTAGVVILAVFALLTSRQRRIWQGSYDLWTHTLAVTVNNFVAEENLGDTLLALRRDDEALPHFVKAVLIQPENATARLNLGTALLHHGRYAEAIDHLYAVTRLSDNPADLSEAYKGLGVASVRLGEEAKAREYFLQAVQFNSHDTNNLYNLSLLELEGGISKLSRSLSFNPTAQGYLQLGQFLQEDQRISEAQDAYEKALRLNPNLAEAKRALLQLRNNQE